MARSDGSWGCVLGRLSVVGGSVTFLLGAFDFSKAKPFGE